MLEAIILAAGNSQRFGDIKQLAMYRHNPMLQHCIAQYFCANSLVKGIRQLTVVLGANQTAIRQLDLSQVTCFVARHWQNGIGASIADFVGQINADCSHLLIGLGDQVALTTQDISNLISCSAENPDAIVCAQYAGIKGVPAIFPRAFFNALGQLNGDQGARAILAQHAERLIALNMPNAEVDIDTPEQLALANDQ